jgi:DNA replication and repair protein RecF
VLLQRLTTRNFRNLEPTEYSFHPQVNLFLGNNGQGKTNLLEAIYFLATTKSFRTSKLGSLFRFETANLFVGGTLRRGELEQTMSVGLENAESRARVLLLNAQKVTLARYLQSLTVFAYSAARLEVIRGAPEEKRRFLDRGIASVQHGYLDQLTRFGRVLKQRNALLQAVAARTTAPSVLEPWDEEFLIAARTITLARARYAERLARVFNETVAQYRYHVAGLTFAYRPGGIDYREGDAAAWRAQLHKLRRDELRMRVSLTGPHRDTLIFEVDGRPATEVLSGGELKTLILFLKFAKLAIYRHDFEEPAVFLLDDVDAELDLPILEGLLSRLPESTQVFATSAKESYLKTLQAAPHRRFVIEAGRLTDVENS